MGREHTMLCFTGAIAEIDELIDRMAHVVRSNHRERYNNMNVIPTKRQCEICLCSDITQSAKHWQESLLKVL